MVLPALAFESSTSVSPVFVRDAAHKLQTLTWSYEVNDGLPLTVPVTPGDMAGAMTFTFSELTLSINPQTMRRTMSVQAALTGTVSDMDLTGSARVQSTEMLEETNAAVYIKRQQDVQTFTVAAGGVTRREVVTLDTTFTPGLSWFLDKQRDDLTAGTEITDEVVSANVTGAVVTTSNKVTTTGFSYVNSLSNRWMVLAKVPAYTVGSFTYTNVVQVERTAWNPSGAMDGATEPVTNTYWFAQGVGMVEGAYNFKGRALSIKLTSGTLMQAVVTARIEPLGNGTVSGCGTYAPGKTVTLKATPAKGFTFAQWENGSQIPTRVFTANRTFIEVSATFVATTDITVPAVTKPDDQRATVGVAFRLAPLEVRSESKPTVTVTGLPAGLKYDAATLTIAGVPTKTGTNRVTISASNVNNQQNAATTNFTITVAPLPVWATGDFTGDVSTERDGMVGVVACTVTALGKIAGTLAANGAYYAFAIDSYQPASTTTQLTFSGIARAGKVQYPITVSVYQNAVEKGVDGDGTVADDAQVRLYRVAPQAVMGDYYTSTLSAGPEYGHGFLTLTVNGGVGGVKLAGQLADGTAVTLSGSLYVEPGTAKTNVLLYTAPPAYQGGSFRGMITFTNTDLRGTYIWDNENPVATAHYEAEGFYREGDIAGGWYKKTAILKTYYTNGLEVACAALPALTDTVVAQTNASPAGIVLRVTADGNNLKAPNVVQPKNAGSSYSYTNASSGLSVTFVQATGLIRGTFKVWYDYTTTTLKKVTRTHISKPVSYTGVITPENELGVAGGAGYFLMQAQGQSAGGKSYKYYESYAIGFEQPAQ
jgi:hypothetical protein